ncbi:MAG: xanthine dehydrogenase family protein subunit M [Desulfobacterota bacterium]|nr:xanthine dehydrogenase family protein subunit M [Thermodesulfobacteriota bacterium]
MYLPQFEYHAPKTTEELSSLLSKYQGKARILCGGTDLIVAMKDKLMQPDCVIDISDLSALSGIQQQGKGVVIGAATKLDEIERSVLIREKYYALYQGASVVGSPQVRAMGTLGGNSCTASPAADTPPPLIALGARVNLVCGKGVRQMALEEFILGNRRTALEEDEFLESFVLEEPWPKSASRYLIMGLRGAMEIDMVNVAVNLALDPGSGKVREVRIVLGAVAPTPLRARQAESLLKGNLPAEGLLDRVSQTCAEESKPIDDFRATAAYRREIVKVLSKRALKEVLSAIG